MLQRWAISVAHAVLGWALCGAVMGAALSLTSVPTALAVHAAAAPVIFALLSWAYFRRFGWWSPLRIAAVFTACVIVLDVVVVAAIMQRSFDMFRSIPGTWLPFALIFLATWATGREASRPNRG